MRTVVRWVETHSNWDESVLIVSSDHGHYLVVDDLAALAGEECQIDRAYPDANERIYSRYPLRQVHSIT